MIQRSSMADFPDSPQLMLVKFPESYIFVGQIPMFVGQIQGFSLVNPRVAFLNHT